MGQFTTVELILIILNVAITWYTFQNNEWFEKLIFESGPTRRGEWYRLVSAGFLHVSWNHLFFNMITLYFFASAVEDRTGSLNFLIIYLVSLVGGNLLALLFHRGEEHYRAVGASGAVSGVVYAAIALFPEMELAFIFIPIPFPAWVYGIGFIIYSLYGIGAQRDNIGHEAHLGGAITGLLMALVFHPSAAQENPMTIIYILVPAVVILIVMLVKPSLLQMALGNSKTNQTQDDRFREKRAENQKELNRILDKINEQGANNLTPEEKDFLEKHS